MQDRSDAYLEGLPVTHLIASMTVRSAPASLLLIALISPSFRRIAAVLADQPIRFENRVERSRAKTG